MQSISTFQCVVVCAAYNDHKREAELANSRATDMWAEAKKYISPFHVVSGIVTHAFTLMPQLFQAFRGWCL